MASRDQHFLRDASLVGAYPVVGDLIIVHYILKNEGGAGRMWREWRDFQGVMEEEIEKKLKTGMEQVCCVMVFNKVSNNAMVQPLV